MTEEKTCHNCGNKNCNVYYSMVKKNCKRHYETYEYRSFDCVNHDKWEELKVEEIRTDNTETLKNALERIKELEKENAELKSIAEFQTSSNMDRYFQLKRSKEQLTKAKEIIRDLLSCLYSVEYDRVSDLEEAEQFLKEV